MLHLPIILTIASCTLAAKLNVVHEWKYIDYVWESEVKKLVTIFESGYNYKKIFTVDVQTVRDGRVFVTTPRASRRAVPATLSTVSDKKGPGGPLLQPYPNWKIHNSRHCKGITSVWRTEVDDCNRLWVLDSGKIGADQVCPAQLLVFDLQTDELLKTVKVPSDISHNPYNETLGRLSHPIVETEGDNCERTWVYIVDYDGGGLIVFDGSKMWRLNDDVFQHYPALSRISIVGATGAMPNGIFGLALSPETSSASRHLFFNPLASTKEYSVSVNDLHGSANAEKNLLYNTLGFPSRITAQAFSGNGILFLGLIDEKAIACWNAKTRIDEEHVVVVAQDDETLQFTNAVKVTRYHENQYKEEVWIATNRLQEIGARKQNFDHINFRILSASVATLVKGTKCHLRRRKSKCTR